VSSSEPGNTVPSAQPCKGLRRPRHTRGLLPLALWLGAFLGLRALRDALLQPRPDALSAFLFLPPVWTGPLFSRWIVIRVYGGSRWPRRVRYAVRWADIIAIAWTGYVIGGCMMAKAILGR